MLQSLYDQNGGGVGVGASACLGAPYLSICHDGQKYIGPQSVCEWRQLCGNAERQLGGGGGAAAAGDRNRLPSQQTSYLGEAAVEKEAG